MRTLLVSPGRITEGSIEIAGFKHAATVIMAASVALKKDVVIHNAPDILDTHIISDIINSLGGLSHYQESCLRINCSQLNNWNIPRTLAEKIHGAIYLIPVLLGRFKQVSFSSFGGCAIGENGGRPLQHMLDVLSYFGAHFSVNDKEISGRIDEFSPCTIDIMKFSDFTDNLTGPLVSGATKTAILASMFVTQGVTKILNPYLKPDVTELLEFLKLNGFDVQYNKNEIIIFPPIIPIDTHSERSVTMTLLSDLSEIITYLTLSALSGKKIILHCKNIDRVVMGLQAELNLFARIGICIHYNDNAIYAETPYPLKANDVVVKSTGIYSDHQPFFALLLCYADGKSSMEERVWKHRFSYAHELNKMGTAIAVCDNKITINPTRLHSFSQSLQAQDLRSAAVLLVAAIVRNGETTINGSEHLERGYTHLMANLSRLGVRVQYL
ncbi:hypothetical protein [Serratia quinivorans]|uniref:hypothetical protein n=1 Tax=Serratia quinivorans TaxID=137545 RepID=UPI00217A0B0A|nr:hypothetical protein [Serratia quinivorans]CAI0942340.1 UDP-N-acetylglucosamine 1-carboxyvinyltransferase 2 [Serratia quinivorans]CAI1740781.1 UDP-N-acetylglucosamine 1-carboxyvinyltransferase 2 [Serratia quinivorans]